jgi:hypothetical protein
MQVDGNFAFRSGIYIGDLRLEGGTQVAVISDTVPANSAATMDAYRKAVAPTADDLREKLRMARRRDGEEISFEKPEGVRHLEKAAIQRVNPGKKDLIADLKESEQTTRMYGSGMERPDLTAQADRTKAVVAALEKNTMTPDAYGVVEKRIMDHLKIIYRDIEREMPTAAVSGWEYVFACTNDLQKALEEARGQIRAFREAQLARRSELAQGRKSAANAAEAAFITAGLEGMTARTEELIQPYRKARNAVMKELGVIVLAANWYNESNPRPAGDQ